MTEDINEREAIQTEGVDPSEKQKRVTDIAEIRHKVEERRQAESATSNPGPGMKGGSGGGITRTFIQRALYANELGDGMIFAEHFRDQYVFAAKAAETYLWAGHFWALDVLNTELAAVETVAEIYLEEAHRLVSDIDAAIKAKNKEAVAALEDLQGKIYKRVLRLRSDRGRVNTIKFAHTNPENAIAISGDEFDRDPWLLACLNGVVDLRTGQLRPGRPSDYITKVAPVEWLGLYYPSLLWERFFFEILQGDVDTIDFLSRLFGYSITGVIKEHIFPIFVGEGRNGKGTIFETLFYVLGDYAAPINPAMLLQEKYPRGADAPRPATVELKGMRLLVASEPDENVKLATSRIKSLCSADTQTGRGIQDRRATVFPPTHKIHLATNNLPQVPYHDFAFWERCVIIRFFLNFVTREPSRTNERPADIHLPEKLKAEASGILAWLVRGCLAWQNHGLNPPKSVILESKEYRKQQDNIGIVDFIEQCCEVNNYSWTSSIDLYNRFKTRWVKIGGDEKKIPTINKFGRDFVVHFTRNKKNDVHGYQGVRLKNSID